MNMLPRLRPTRFYDLVIQVAIVRPGPIQGQMVHPYLRRRQGKEPVEYPHPKLKAILDRTHGVPLFQEQVMRLAEAVGGYTPGQADQLRRDMARWSFGGRLEQHRNKLLSGMRRNGLSDAFAQRVIQQIEGFGSYGFPESHAAAFAHLAYVSAYLKCHFPAAFGVALINSQPMGFYSPAVIVNDLKRHGVEVLSVDVLRSDWDCTLEEKVDEKAVRLGLRLVRGLGEEAGRRIQAEREKGAFASVEALTARAQVPSRVLTSLAAAGALASLQPGHRRQAVWRALGAGRPMGPLLRGVPAMKEPTPRLAAPSVSEELAWDSQYAGAFPGRHPMELLRARLRRERVLSAADFKKTRNRQVVTVAGLVITRQRPGSGKVIYVTLEDETGHVDVAIHEKVYERFRITVRLSGALKVRGSVETDGEARNVRGHHFEPLEIEAQVSSHDFH
jgi:error-prone DNA polymerase